jgi:hypothetical protein
MDRTHSGLLFQKNNWGRVAFENAIAIEAVEWVQRHTLKIEGNKQIETVIEIALW